VTRDCDDTPDVSDLTGPEMVDIIGALDDTLDVSDRAILQMVRFEDDLVDVVIDGGECTLITYLMLVLL